MIDVDVEEEKENVLNFNLNKNITTYKDFIEYFYNLSVDDKNEIIFYMLLYKKYFSELKNGNLDKIYNMYKILLHKLEYVKLNYKEKFIYEHIMAYLIISGNFKNDELFEKYVCVYLSNVTKCNFNNRLFIILQDIVNKLNKEYNKECTLKFVDQNAIASTNWFNKDLRYNILLSSNKFWRNYELKKIDDINLLYTFVTNAFIILHEYKHILQNEYMRNIDDDLAKIYKFESWFSCFWYFFIYIELTKPDFIIFVCSFNHSRIAFIFPHFYGNINTFYIFTVSPYYLMISDFFFNYSIVFFNIII